MAAEGLSEDDYRWRWNYRVRQVFALADMERKGNFTVEQQKPFSEQSNGITKDISKGKRTNDNLNKRLNVLIKALNLKINISDLTDVPPKESDGVNQLNRIYPANKLPKVSSSTQKDDIPKGRPIIPEAEPVRDATPLRVITLPEDAPDIFKYIRTANSVMILRELQDLAYDPDQTVKITLPARAALEAPGAAAAAAPAALEKEISVTPLQYAALSAPKGIVRILIQKSSSSDISKTINDLPIEQAIDEYRSRDIDRNEVKRTFEIARTAIQDAVLDALNPTTLKNKLDPAYGDGLTKEADKKFAKNVYIREYNELELPKIESRTVALEIENAKKAGKENGSKGEDRDKSYDSDAKPKKSIKLREGYGKEYDKAYAEFRGKKDATDNKEKQVLNITNFSSFYDSDSKHKDEVNSIYNKAYDDVTGKTTGLASNEAKQKGKEDGSRGIPMNPDYKEGADPPKSAREQEAYGKEYDKALAAYYGEKDGRLNEDKNIFRHIKEFSTFVKVTPLPPAVPTDINKDDEHTKQVNKLYEDSYNANRSKVTDIAKEAGYVGTYPINEDILSGNYFGFGPELSKIIGIDSTSKGSQPKNDAAYNEGLAVFIKEFNKLVGQAKYAGYTDGIKKNAKYTTPGNITVDKKQYAVDFGKLNTRLKRQPKLDSTGKLEENTEYVVSQKFLNDIKSLVDQPESVMPFELFKNNVNDLFSSLKEKTLIERLKPILLVQKGGASLLEKQRLRTSILDIKNDSIKDGFLKLVDNPEYTNIDEQFNFLKGQVNTQLITQKKEDIRLLIEQLPEEQRANYLKLLETTDDLNNLNIFESTIKNNPVFSTSVEEPKPPKQSVSTKDIDGIKSRIEKLKNITTKEILLNRVVPTLTKQEYRTLDIDIAKAYNRELGLFKTIQTLADPVTKQTLLDEYKAVSTEPTLVDLETKVKNELAKNPLAMKIQSLKDKKDFETRFRDPLQNQDVLKQLVDDAYDLENPSIETKLTTGLETVKSTLQSIPTVTTVLGSVTTKQQLYNSIKQALSTIPKYVEEDVKPIPTGLKPDDPSLDTDVNIPLRLQMLYDSEFQRGLRESSKRIGGTRRQTKKSNRYTQKKQRSKK